MKDAVYGVVIFLALIIQTTAFNFTRGFHLWPDLILIIAIHAGLKSGKTRGALIGAAAGFMEDLLSFGAMGANTLTKGVVGLLTGKLRERYINDSSVTRGVIAFGVTILDNFLYGLVMQTFSNYQVMRGSWFSVLIAAMVNLAFVFPILAAIDRVIEWSEKLLHGQDGGKYNTPYLK